MRFNGFAASLALALYPDDELAEGGWTREQLLEMNASFTARLEEMFRLGLERRESAAAQVRLPTNSARFIAPLCPAVQEGLLRSAENALAFVARR
jgi:hypothetical protein